jgi:hypothetical protein
MEGEGPLRRGGDGKCGTLTLGRVGKGLSLPAAAGVAERELAGWGMEWRLGGVGQQQQWGSVFGSTAFWFFISFFFV